MSARGGAGSRHRATGRSPARRKPSATAVENRTSAGGRWALALAVLVVGMFMSVLDISIVNVAIPSIQRDFGSTSQDIQWISTAYSLALGVIVPASGWLGDRFGMGRVYNYSLVAFATGSMLCGFAWNLPSMVVFRILQAIPGGILPVITLTMVYRIVPRQRLGTAMAMYGVGVIFAPAVGPTLGGYLVEYQTWRWIFLINVPLGVVGAVLGFYLLRGFPAVRPGRFDTWGFLSVATGLFALLLAFSEGQDWGWTSYPVGILLVVGLLALALFVVVEPHQDTPLLDVRVFTIWQFSNSLLLVTMLSLGLFAVLFYIPLYLQEGRGVSALYTGLLLLPEAVAMGAILPVAGMIYDRYGVRLPAAAGLAIAAYGTYLLCGVNVDMTPQDVVIWTWVRGIGNGLAMMPIMTAGLAIVPNRLVNQASAINNAAQRVTAALGLAVFTALATAEQAQLMADRSDLLDSRHLAALPVHRMVAQGARGLLPLYRHTQQAVLASAYDDVFLVIALVTAVGAILALTLKVPRQGAAGAAEAPGRQPVAH